MWLMLLSESPSARIVSRFFTTSGSNEPFPVSWRLYFNRTVFALHSFAHLAISPVLAAVFLVLGEMFFHLGFQGGVQEVFQHEEERSVLAKKRFALARNCSLAFAITELSSSFVIVTILSLHYSKVLGCWLWIVTLFILQPPLNRLILFDSLVHKPLLHFYDVEAQLGFRLSFLKFH